MAHWLSLRQEQGREGEVEEWFRQGAERTGLRHWRAGWQGGKEALRSGGRAGKVAKEARKNPAKPGERL